MCVGRIYTIGDNYSHCQLPTAELHWIKTAYKM